MGGDKMKRLLIIILLLALALSLAACSSNNNSGAPPQTGEIGDNNQGLSAPEQSGAGSTATAQGPLPPELMDSGYAVKDGIDTYYIQYAIMVKNPNADKAVMFPTVRLTARDADGAVLGTDEIIGMYILPGETWYSAFQGPSVDSEPASVDFEIVQPDESDWVSPDSIQSAGKPLTVENPVKRNDKIVGEISNPNDFDVESAAVVVFFRDGSGKLLAGDTTYTDKVPAGGKIAFEISLWEEEGYITDNFEVYSYPWYY